MYIQDVGDVDSLISLLKTIVAGLAKDTSNANSNQENKTLTRKNNDALCTECMQLLVPVGYLHSLIQAKIIKVVISPTNISHRFNNSKTFRRRNYRMY